jgi:hypothetical protein
MASVHHPPASASLPHEPLWRRLLAVLMLFVPGPIQQAQKQGMLTVLLVVFLMIFALPPLLVWLAAFALNTLTNLDWPATNALRKSYLEFIYRGFDIEALAQGQAAKQNIRLDYFQLLDFEVRPNVTRSDRISLSPGQRAILQVKLLRQVVPPGTRCSLPPGAAHELLVVRLEDVELRRLKEFDDELDPKQIQIDDDFWRKNIAKFPPAEKARDMTLSFEPSEFVKKEKCGSLVLRGDLKVFKDVYTPGR